MGDSLFDDGSMLRRVHRERVVAFGGQRALLMQAAHPLALAGLLAHTTGLDEPYERLARTARAMNVVYFGSREDAERLTRRIRAQHRRVRGTLPSKAGPHPAGTPYAGDDPDLLLWVLFTLFDSAAEVYRRYVRALDRDEEGALWHDYRTVGELFGLHPDQMPADLDAVDAYREEMLYGGHLHVSDWARRRAREIVLGPPVPLLARPLLETVNFVTLALLPEPIFRQYGFAAVPPRRLRRALVGAGAEYVKRAVLPFVPAQLRLVPATREP